VSKAELRRHPRFKPQPTAPVRVDVMGNGFLEVVHARDVSVSGLSIFVAHDFDGCDIDTEVDLILTFGKSRPFKARAKIRHRSRDGSKHFFGLQFVDLAEEHRAAIARYVSGCTKVLD